MVNRSVLRAVDGSSVSCKMIPLVDEAKERRGRGYKVERGRASCTAKLLLLRAGRESRWWIGETTAIACIRKRSHGVRSNSLSAALYSELTKQFAFQKRETITHA